MAFQFTVNTVPSSHTAAVYALKVALIAAGWTVHGSGDGNGNYNATGDVITSATALAHTDAWFVQIGRAHV